MQLAHYNNNNNNNKVFILFFSFFHHLYFQNYLNKNKEMSGGGNGSDDIHELEILKRQEKMLRNLILNLENQKQRLQIEETDLLNTIE